MNENEQIRPDHYGGKDNPYETIKVLEAWGITNPYLWNAGKYLSRLGKKEGESEEKDIKKIITYCQFRLNQIKETKMKNEPEQQEKEDFENLSLDFITHDEYQNLTRRTRNNLGSKLVDNIHMILGIGSEISELMEAFIKNDKVNIGEELGDICWYISEWCNINGFKLKNLNNANIEEVSAFNVLVSNQSKLQDLYKRELAYNKPVDLIKASESINCCFTAVNILFKYSKLNSFYFLKKNIDKLKTRYPENFTEEKAINRDLEAERKELEK